MSKQIVHENIIQLKYTNIYGNKITTSSTVVTCREGEEGQVRESYIIFSVSFILKTYKYLKKA